MAANWSHHRNSSYCARRYDGVDFNHWQQSLRNYERKHQHQHQNTVDLPAHVPVLSVLPNPQLPPAAPRHPGLQHDC